MEPLIEGVTARQADQGLKHERLKVKCSLVSLKFNGNCYHIRVDELRNYEQRFKCKKERLDLLEIGYIFEHELNVTHILANDFGKFSCVSN